MTLAGLGVTTRTGSGVVAVTVVIPFVYPARDAVAVIVPGVLAFTLIVALPFAPVTPLPVATPVNVTVAPFTSRPEV